MKYCLSSNLKNLNPDEIKCPYNHLGDIYDYMREHPDKRYIIIYTNAEIEDKLFQQLEFVKGTVDNYSISCSNVLVLKKLLKEGYPAFLSYPVSDWETFTNLIDLGVTDIQIDGCLGFSMDKIRRAKEKAERNIFIRVAPTVSANAAIAKEITASSFFIRPEDTYYYEGIIDCFDFQVNDSDVEKTLYEIYQRGSFLHEINLLIKYLNSNVYNSLIGPEFGRHRFSCGQVCKMPGSRCHYCETHLKFVDTSTEYFKKN